jgi:hypothetical protein
MRPEPTTVAFDSIPLGGGWLEKKAVRLIVAAVILAYFGTIIYSIIHSSSRYQWDYRTYYYGGNPYDHEKLLAYSRGEASYRFIYPPMALYLMGLLPRMNLAAGYVLFIALKVTALLLLVYTWRKYFLGRAVPAAFLIIFAFGFREAVASDLRAGNISIYEQCVVWFSLVAYMQQRYRWFAAGITGIALFKFTPIAFLLLLLFARTREKWKILFVSVLLSCGLLVVPFLFKPGLFMPFVGAVASVHERAPTNPSLLAAMQDIAERCVRATAAGSAGASMAAIAMYIGIVAAVLVLTRMALARRRLSPELTIMLACVLMSLLLPRFKDYSYILLVVPAWRAMTMVRNEYLRVALLGLICTTVVLYQQLIAAFVVWLIYVIHIRSATVGGGMALRSRHVPRRNPTGDHR